MLINTILIQRTIERQELWAQLKPEDFRALTPPAGLRIGPSASGPCPASCES
jgi:hypothetical protein